MDFSEELREVVLGLGLVPPGRESWDAAKASVAVSVQTDYLAVALGTVHLPVLGVLAHLGGVQARAALRTLEAGPVKHPARG